VTWVPVSPSSRVASARLRSLRPVDYLARDGWPVALHRHGDRPDVAVFQKAYAPEQLTEARRLKSLGVRIVADFCDNHLWVPRWTPELRARADRMRELLDLADVVVAATPAMAAALERDATVVDDALELPSRTTTRVTESTRTLRRGRSLRLLWFGSAGGAGQTGGLDDLVALLPELRRLQATLPLHLTVVSNDRRRYQDQVDRQIPGRYLPWSKAAFAVAVASADVAVIPVTLDPFTRCKTTNRPATALVHGLACVADPVPSYADLGDTIRIAAWPDSLQSYVDAAARASDAGRGADLVRTLYAPARIRDQWAAVLHAAADSAA
jgi:hypothetical protein